MIPELGQFALILALLVAALQAILPLLGAQTGRQRWIAVARPAALIQCALVGLSFALLTHAFVVQDFSVAYVAQNSNSDLPMLYRYSAVWGAHEGSLLLWALILSIWTAVVALRTRALPDAFVARVLSVLGFVAVGFLLFTILTSNPFLRHVPGLADGNDLNPLLQDPGLIIHPPMLYTGYVGFAVAFAFAVAAMLEGRGDSRWVRWARPWTLVAWAFLTLGIALGSWWAYYELGWGGWWFWDPVENASFMPWLVGTALIHSMIVSDQRQQLLRWTLLLAIMAFSLSLLGTFLVRSGVLTSVHAFAADPTRGVFILSFLGFVTGGALLLYAWRAQGFAVDPGFAPVSRESAILLNNVLLTSAAAMVLLGTLFPLLADAFDWGKISVGPPYFGTLFPMLMAPVVFLVAFAPYVRWRGDTLSRFVGQLKPVLLVALVVAALAFALTSAPWKATLGVFAGVWVIAAMLHYVRVHRADPQRRARGFNRATIGMLLAHAGIGVFVIGVFVTEATSIEKDVRLVPGESIEVRGYRFVFEQLEHREGPNFAADRGVIGVFKGDRRVETLYPEKRQYRGGQVMTEADLDPGLSRDLYVAMGEPVGDNNAWAIRIYHKPFIRWIWLGALFMMFGGFIAALDPKLRAARDTARRGHAAEATA
ncbi:MAG: heme lyase CcmF/NrfE family subunit [Rhodanobacteraceae bacterium]|nr:heme lyase CcmF/NrfE family subunit [Rhodanobacteraceae bacterium]MBK7043339.1 heme lyase CcmF/NrfE family subunit [Rhodanobacteraceae bacterium]MBP9155160.1 heme lyase CcmF/NrfE family subunit [Xanthomonadales bacterium]HQW80983.1 heme lyase CcmF/NrfE family subunit [Pseudomonadota bacterium]